jgi:hypothetical protein
MAEGVNNDHPSRVRPRIQGPIAEAGEEVRAYKKVKFME